MTTRKFSIFLVSLIFSLILSFSAVLADDSTTDVQINDDLTYQAHVSNIGWMNPVHADEEAGTTGQNQSLEALRINTNAAQLRYSAHVRDVGWQNDVTNDQVAGTEGQNAPIEAIKISLVDAPNVDLYYRVHAANFGWLGWAKNGEVAGTTGCAFPVQAIQILAAPKGAPAPGDTTNASIDKSQITLSVRTHVSNLGWQNPVAGGESGTVGRNLGVEAIEVKVNDPTGKSGAVGQAFISNIGEQNAGNPNDAIGTTGQNLPIEAVRFSLVGPAAEIYDLEYNTHCTNLGWLPTTTRNNWAGSKDGALKVESVNVHFVKKGTTEANTNSIRIIDKSLGIIPPAPTCIVINKAIQRMGYYEDYNLIVNTNVVTGMSWIDDTKAGDWSVLEKLPNYRTKGPGYDAVVDYWLTLYVGRIDGFAGEGTINDRVGIHDADWRTDWSSNAYTYNGSHGCVNTPYDAMKTIYTRVPQGAPVRIR